jgi:hypothetical protein
MDFPFWRFTYGYDFVADENLDVYGGLALQLRNASIVFARKLVPNGHLLADHKPESWDRCRPCSPKWSTPFPRVSS